MGIVTSLRAGGSGVRILAGAEDIFLFPKTSRPAVGAHPFRAREYLRLFEGESAGARRWLRLMLRLGISGSVPLRLPYAFVVCTRMTLLI